MLQTLLGLKIAIQPSNFPEDLDKAIFTPVRKITIACQVIFDCCIDETVFSVQCAYVKENAYRKALDVYETLSRGAGRVPSHPSEAGSSAFSSDGTIIIAADTVVVQDGRILEKPADATEAFSMIQSLSGRSHHVHSGLCLFVMHPCQCPAGVDCSCKPQVDISSETTTVHFTELPESVIRAYVATPIPYDKAGGYGIQSPGSCTFVSKVDGCYYNVVGFPLSSFAIKVRAIMLAADASSQT
jgi:MAF protein